MLTVTNVEVTRALLWLGMRGVAIPDRTIAFALEEDFSDSPQANPYAIACALLDAVEEASVLLAGEQRPQQSIYTPRLTRTAADDDSRGADPRGEGVG